LEQAQLKLEKAISIIGFYQPSSKKCVESTTEQDAESKLTEEKKENDVDDSQKDESDINNNNKDVEDDKVDDAEEDNEEDDEEGWISSSILQKRLNTFDDEIESSIVDQKLKVACMTADFSMQVRDSFLFFN
jgi:hypothetical protein